MARWLILAAALAMGSCARDGGPHPELPFVGVTSQYTSRNLCGLGQTPELQIYDAPSATTRLRVKITNVTALAGPSWEATVPAALTIPEGALPGVPNPCPPELQTYTYRFEVLALANDGRSIGYGWNFITVPSLTRQLQNESQSPSAAHPTRRGPGEVPRPPYFVY